RIVFNIVWLVLFGWGIALTHLAAALVLFVTIIGIPFAIQHIKLIPLALFPFGRDLQ
ncbi:MAG TPA: YccF domain-containing protein, partial [Polyangia bacterium]|nr:YccF domain-containing protein [Polyangia bacterium]